MIPGISVPGQGNSLSGGTTSSSADGRVSTSDLIEANVKGAAKSFVFNNSRNKGISLVQGIAIAAAALLFFVLVKKRA